MKITVSAAVFPRIGGPSRAWSKLAILAACLGVGPAATRAQQHFYWDTNGATAGSGTNVTGTWDTSAFWRTESDGNVATAYTAGSDGVFSAGDDAVSGTVTVSVSQGAHGITFRSGQTTLSSGTLGIGAGNRNVESTALSPLTSAGLISSSVIIAVPQTCLALARTGIAAAACAARRRR